MKIGLLSDTHGHLPEEVFVHFKDCDEIWHAGDIGSMEVVNKLKAFKTLKAVYGNIDDLPMQKLFPENLFFNCASFDVLITHIGGSPPNYNKRTKELLQHYSPQIFICGHSHILKIEKDIKRNGMLFINPGAAGNQGFHKHKTLVKFVLERGQISNLQVIDLGKRG